MKLVVLAAIVGFFLFIIIVAAVKMAVKEALIEVKEEIVREFNLKKANEDERKN
jgi:hypothetical protein